MRQTATGNKPLVSLEDQKYAKAFKTQSDVGFSWVEAEERCIALDPVAGKSPGQDGTDALSIAGVHLAQIYNDDQNRVVQAMVAVSPPYKGVLDFAARSGASIEPFVEATGQAKTAKKQKSLQSAVLGFGASGGFEGRIRRNRILAFMFFYVDSSSRHDTIIRPGPPYDHCTIFQTCPRHACNSSVVALRGLGGTSQFHAHDTLVFFSHLLDRQLVLRRWLRQFCAYRILEVRLREGRFRGEGYFCRQGE